MSENEGEAQSEVVGTSVPDAVPYHHSYDQNPPWVMGEAEAPPAGRRKHTYTLDFAWAGVDAPSPTPWRERIRNAWRALRDELDVGA